jgi:hypothetical protein
MEMAAATERVVVLMTPAQKRALAKARRLGSSAAELVRRSVDAFDPAMDDEEIMALLDVLVESHRSTFAAIDQAEREVAITRAYFAAKRSNGGSSQA